MAATNSDACSCRYEWTNDYYTFFKNATNLFVGEVTSVTENSEYKIFEFKVIDKLRGDFKSTELVYTSKKGMCQLFVSKGVHLIEVHKQNGKLHASYCSFKESDTCRTFKEDTALINRFGHKSFTVNSTYFKGKVVNDKRVGVWTYYYRNDTSEVINRGEFVKNKKHGLWISYGDTSYYHNGEFIKRYSYVENYPDTVTVYRKLRLRDQSILYYKNGSIYKRRTKNDYRVYYPNGALKESVAINRHGYFYKTWNKYAEDGTLRESIRLENKNEFDSRDYCCSD